MKVRDLIEALQKHDLDAEIWIDEQGCLDTLDCPRIEVTKLKTFLEVNSAIITYNIENNINRESNVVVLDISYDGNYVDLEDDV